MANETESTGGHSEDQESLVSVWSSQNFDAESEGLAIKALLDANEIPSTLVGPRVLPNLEFQIQVPEHLLGDAARVIREARQAGPGAAAEAEEATE